jgi:anti-sigma factor RsiW
MTPHLTHEQLCDMLLARSPHPLSSDFAALQHHLGACPSCAAELASLRTSLTLFREVSVSYSQHQLAEFCANNAPVAPLKPAVQPIYWAAAAVLCIAATLPIILHRQTPSAPATSISATNSANPSPSDEALLEEINQEISAPIPSPMRPLADPTASSATTPSTSSQRN